MTVHLQCDYCDASIEEEDEHVTIDAHGCGETSDLLGWRYVSEYLGHYHATLERPCYQRMWCQIFLVHQAASLERIPTTTAAKITRLRSKHLKGEA
jgi:hypothetical protein